MDAFDKWVLKNFAGQGFELFDPPADWDRGREFFYIIDRLHYRIPYAKVPEQFANVIALGRATSGL